MPFSSIVLNIVAIYRRHKIDFDKILYRFFKNGRPNKFGSMVERLRYCKRGLQVRYISDKLNLIETKQAIYTRSTMKLINWASKKYIYCISLIFRYLVCDLYDSETIDRLVATHSQAIAIEGVECYIEACGRVIGLYYLLILRRIIDH